MKRSHIEYGSCIVRLVLGLEPRAQAVVRLPPPRGVYHHRAELMAPHPRRRDALLALVERSEGRETLGVSQQE